MEPRPTPEPIRIHINSDDPEIIWKAVQIKAAEFCMKFNCAAVITKVATIGEDGQIYLGYEIEKITPVANH